MISSHDYTVTYDGQQPVPLSMSSPTVGGPRWLLKSNVFDTKSVCVYQPHSLFLSQGMCADPPAKGRWRDFWQLLVPYSQTCVKYLIAQSKGISPFVDFLPGGLYSWPTKVTSWNAKPCLFSFRCYQWFTLQDTVIKIDHSMYELSHTPQALFSSWVTHGNQSLVRIGRFQCTHPQPQYQCKKALTQYILAKFCLLCLLEFRSFIYSRHYGTRLSVNCWPTLQFGESQAKDWGI